ncbi:DUF2591 domain-containing protein [Pseudomonas viridiflava]|nr:DUF2591 domain-containing protein [Pseudomonas viridiflava]
MSEFTEVKTEELSGEALNWAVAIAEKLTAFVAPPQYGNPHLVCVMGDYFSRGGYRYSPSTDWSQIGPLIAKHRIDLTFDRDGLVFAYLCDQDGLELPSSNKWEAFGETHLIAACRAIVASVLGETVSVPTELLI